MPDTPLACGLDIGGTKILAQAFDPADPSGPALEQRVPTPDGDEGLLAAAVSMVRELDEQARDEKLGRIRSVGVGVAGLVDRHGALRFGPNLRGIVDVPLRDRLAAELDLPVVVENDATVATWGEHRAGAGLEVDDLVLVTLGTGIGAGIVTRGLLLVGANGFAGEVGHMVVDPTGPRCPCGRRGCWERFASGSALGRLGREAAQAGQLGGVVAEVGGDPEDVRGEHVTNAAAAGDEGALEVFDDFAWWVALGLANLGNLLDPQRFVIAGGLVAAGEVLLEPVRRYHQHLLFASERRPAAEIVAASLGESAGAIGAGLLSVEG